MTQVIDTYELSPMQAGMLFHAVSAGRSGVDVEQVVATLHEPLDEALFLRAWQRVAERHPILRTRFRWQGIAEPIQEVVDRVEIPVEKFDWRALAEGERRQKLQALLDHDRDRSFDLGEVPLMRLTVLRNSEIEYQVLWTFHHALLDGRSFPVVLREVFACYESCVHGKDGALPPARPYRDYIDWLRTFDHNAAKPYWQRILAGFRAPTPLVVARERDTAQGAGPDRGAHEIRLPVALTAALRARAREASVTLNTLLQGAWALLSHRYSGESDIMFGATRACRKSALGGADDMIGLFINTLPMRVNIDPDFELVPWLRRLRAQQVAVRDFEHTPLVKVQGWSEVPRGRPFFESILVFENQSLDSQLRATGGAWSERGFRYLGQTNYPLTVVAYGDQEMQLQIEYSRRRFADDVVERMLGHLRTLLEGMADHPAARLKDLPLLTKAEWHQAVSAWNKSVSYPKGTCLHERFEKQVERAPHEVALVYEGEKLSYAELNRRANRLAHRLRELGVVPDQLVGLRIERGVEMVIAILGILKAGGAYLPLDPVYPKDRVAFMLEDSRVGVVVTQESLAADLDGIPVTRVLLDEPLPGTDTNPAPVANADNLAYVIYTSGSTGKPKGALITHYNVTRLFEATDAWYHFNKHDVWTLFHSYAFDFSVWELWGALLYGGRVVIVPYWTSRSPEAFRELLVRERVTVLNQTPSAFRQLIQADLSQPKADLALRYVIFGGEALELQSLRPWFERYGDEQPQLVNMYGITETTVHVTYRPIRQADLESRQGSVIGIPIPDLQVYILDPQGQPAPIGVPGEMYVGGAGVARGYLNRAELTAERFVLDPFHPAQGARLYRTGDLARRHENGDIEYLGRIDHQVKIRGFRIELGEIEAGIARHPAVREVAVLAQENVPGDKRLVAYIAVENPPTALIDQLRALILTTMPEYMVPAHFVMLAALPLTENGKVDRKALPAPEGAASSTRVYEAPIGRTETTLAQIWADVLKIERVGRHDHFFESGGHSLLAVSVIERMRREGLHADIRTLFVTPTLAELAASVGGDSGIVEVPPNRIPPACDVITPEMLPLAQLTFESIERIVGTVPGGAANVQDIYPLAPLQEGILFHHLMASEGDPYLMFALFGFNSRDRLDQYLQALQAVIDRHDILRTAVLWEGLPEPVQVVWRRAHLAVEEVAIATAAGDVAQQLRARFDPRHYRLDVRQAPLLRVFIAHDTANARWVMLQLFHHLSIDHTTLEVAQQEIQAHLLGQAEQLPTPLPFRNFVAQARLGVPREEHKAFFQTMLGDVNEPTAPFGLIDVQGDGSGITETRREIDAPLARRLRSRARALGVSAASVCHLAWAQVLARVSGRDDVVFGTLLFGRMQGGAGADRVLGLFINTLPVRIRVGDESVKDSVQHTHALLAQLLRHEHAPLSLAQRCSAVAAPAPLFSALLNYRHSGAPTQALIEASQPWEGIESLGFEERTNYPLTLCVDDLGEGFALTAQVQSPIDPQRMCAFMHTALEQLVSALELTPDTPIRSVDVMPESERHQLLFEWNATRAGYPHDKCLHERFEARAAEQPDAIAVTYEEQQLTYSQLNARANRLAHYLRDKGVKPDVLVGLAVERSLDLVIGLLGILKAGGAYVPLDPTYPAERLSFMVEDAGIKLLVTQESCLKALPVKQAEMICLDRDGPKINRMSETNPLSAATRPEHLAYVIYTSGSTGKPKGALITHYNVTRLFEATDAWYHFDKHDVWTLFHSYAFDFSVWELWGALLYGGRVVIVPYWTSRSPEAFRELLVRERVTVLNQTPSAFRQLIQADLSQPKADLALRYVIFGGEALELQSLRPWFERYGDEQPLLVNMYGITETTVHVTYRPIRQADLESRQGSVIGIPIPDLQVYILDPQGQPAPIGVPGEMYVGGAGVARGYLNRAELTAQRFVLDPFHPAQGARLYRTGDLARRHENGDIEYLGRIDHQVKIRGFRIELGEIEAAIGEHPAVRDNVVLARADAPGDKRLVAYLATESEPMALIDELRARLKERLPEYMLPAAFVALPALPLTANGKVDRKALPAPDFSRTARREPPVPPRNEVEKTLAGIWSAVLHIDSIGVHDNFFELGGDSILSIQVITRAREAGIAIKPKQLFQSPSIAGLAALASSQAAAHDEQETLTGPVPLTPIQRWFFEQELPDPDHWNQAFLFEAEGRFDRKRLESAVLSLVNHHDSLRLRFTRVAEEWRQEYAAAQTTAPFVCVELNTVSDADLAGAVEKAVAELQASLCLAHGPILRVAYLDCGPARNARLALVIHHLAVDGVSWRILIEDLQKAYLQLSHGDSVAFAPKTTSYRRWAERMIQHAGSAIVKAEHEYWMSVLSGPMTHVPVDLPGASLNTEASSEIVVVRLGAEETRTLLQQVPKAYGTQINDALLAALARALAKWMPGEGCLVNLEGHGREDIAEDVDLSRSVGWFTTIFPIELEFSRSSSPADMLKSVKEKLRMVPQKGLGYGLLRHLGAGIFPSSRSRVDVAFNYLGQFDQVVGSSSILRFARESCGPMHSLRGTRSHILEVVAIVEDGALEIRWIYSRNLHRCETIKRVASDYLRALREIIEHCAAARTRSFTPSDFPLALVNQKKLDELVTRFDGIEDIYPLSPMQRLFHSMESANSKIGFEQWHFVLEGPLDTAAFQRAWQHVLSRHPILRTAFVADGFLDPLQIVKREVTLPWLEQDWRAFPVSAHEARLREYLEADRERGFDLTVAPLTRVAVIRVAEKSYHLVWSTHHLQIDGWSWPLIFRDIAEFYEAERQRAQTSADRPCAYRQYVEWLEHHPVEESEQFWRHMLRGVTSPTPLELDGARNGDTGATDFIAFESVSLSREDTDRLQAFARQHQLTLNTLVQAAWAMLLGHVSGKEDVVFGVACAGRPTDVPGIETMVGPCVNNVPIRVALPANEPFLGWLSALQRTHFECLEHQYTPLHLIQAWSDVPPRYRLFDSLLVFQNYAVDDATRHLGSRVKIRPVSSPDATNYPLALVIHPGPELRLILSYRLNRIDGRTIAALIGQLGMLLTCFPQSTADRITDMLGRLPASSKGIAMSSKRAISHVTAPHAAPTTEMERKIAAIWEELFEVDSINVEENFFDLGGHSLLLIKAHQKLREILRENLSIVALLQYPTVRTLAQHLGGAAQQSLAPAAALERVQKQREAMLRQRTIRERR